MLHTLKLQLLNPMLGNIPTQSGVRKFKRLNSGAVAFDSALWSWACTNAIRQLKLDISEDAIRPERGWCRTPRVVLYRRNWTKDGVPQTDSFESFPEKTEIHVKMFLAQSGHGTLIRTPTPAEMVSIAEIVGEYFGLSPWGTKFGYGRFSVLSFTQV